MRHKFDPQIEVALAGEQGDWALAPSPRGDWQQMREYAETMFKAAAASSSLPDDVTVSIHEAQSRDGNAVAMRWYQRGVSAPGSAVLYIHGGGMISGSAEYYDAIVAQYVSITGVPMLSVDYSLAPEHPHPRPLEDCITALSWLIDNASDKGINPARIAVMGDSAGGGLAAALAIAAREKGIVLAAQILIYPMLDDRNTEVEPAIAPFTTWTADNNWTGWHALIGDLIGGPNVPALAAPARLTDFRGLAPAYVEVGDLDIFRNESIAFALNLAKAGVPIELHVRPGAPHGFEYFAANADVTARAMADRIRAISQL